MAFAWRMSIEAKSMTWFMQLIIVNRDFWGETAIAENSKRYTSSDPIDSL